MNVRLAALALATLALCACRRPDPGVDARVEVELAGGWVREIRDGAVGLEGFDLRADGSLALLGIFSMNGVAWNYAQGELVLSTNTDRTAQTTPVRLRVQSFENGLLTLGPADNGYFAGSYRRSAVRHLAGVVTYVEPVPLPPDARVEVWLSRGDARLARALVSPRGPVPIAFSLSYLPQARPETLALEARIAAPEGPLFATKAPLAVVDGSDDVQVVVRPVGP